MSFVKLLKVFTIALLLSFSYQIKAADICTSIGASYYYTVTHADMRMCPSPMCGGYFVKQVNKLKTLCADGVWRDECHVIQLDAKAMGWAQQQTNDYFNTVFGTKTGIVRGNFAHALDANIPALANTTDVLTITEAWQAQSKNVSSSPVYHVKDLGIVCIAYPCLDDTIERLLNAWEMKDKVITDTRLNNSGATQAQINAGYKALAGDGILVAGTHRLTTDKLGKLLIANQFYLPAPSASTVGQACGGTTGVSCATGEVCNISTPNACGSATAQGVCQIKYDVCPMYYMPVCGCDGVTYSNDCARVAAGAQLNYAGACK